MEKGDSTSCRKRIVGKLTTRYWNVKREIPDDILKEHRDEIKDALFAFFWDKIKRGVTVNFPEFYKQELAKRAFTETSQSDETV